MTTIKNSAIALLVTVLFASNSFATNVINPVPAVTATSENPLSVQYIGEEDGYLFFQVSVNTLEAKKASLSINDKNEGEIYSAALSNNKTQTLKIEKRENQELNFQLQIGKNNFSKSFIVVPTVVLSKL
jgi:hypothetical protein